MSLFVLVVHMIFELVLYLDWISGITYFLPFPISTLFTYGGMMYINLNHAMRLKVNIGLAIGCFLILFSNIFLFYIFSRFKESINESKRLELQQIKDNLNENYYRKLDEKNKMNGQIIHDMNCYFETIGRLAIQNKNSNIIKILEEINLKIEASETYTFCSNIILNAIITEKSMQAKVININFFIQVDPLINVNFINDVDLISVFGNLINNAIEATQKCKDKYIKIQLSMTEKDKFVMIIIENTFAVTPKRVGINFETQKNNKDNHGIGLINTRKIVESYGGLLDIEVTDNKFIVSMIFSTTLT